VRVGGERNVFLRVLPAIGALGFFLLPRPSEGAEIRELYRGVRRMAMGGAGVALADDVSAVYINPAGLAGNLSTSLHPLILDTGLSVAAVTSYLSGGTTFSNFDSTSISSLIGSNYFAQVQATPTLLVKNFAISLYADAQAALLTRNLALPDVTIGYMNTYGIQAATGFSLFRKKRARSDLRLGLAGKILWRRGGYRRQTLSELVNLSAESLATFAGAYSMAYSGDIGLQFLFKAGRGVLLSAGLTGQNLGSITFADAGVDRVEECWSFGLGADFSFRGAPDFRIAFDHRNITRELDWRLKNHFGLEVSLPLFRVQAGYSQSYLTYGAAFDLWILKVSVTSYAAELGSQLLQEPDRRWQLGIDTRLPL
jgi:hypothetical protein